MALALFACLSERIPIGNSQKFFVLSYCPMTKRRPNSKTNRRVLEALLTLPSPIEDKKNGLLIYFVDDQSRSNQTRFEHIIQKRHCLKVRDIQAIPEGIANKAIIKKDSKKRKWTFCYFFLRPGSQHEYIKIAVQRNSNNSHEVFVKTIYIAKTIK